MKGMDIFCREVDKDKPGKVIDFHKAKADGIDFIIPRDGFGTQKIDPKFIEYVNGARDAGIEIPGVFHFIYAINVEQAVQNASRAIKNVKAAGLPKSTVIWCDIEYDTVADAKKQGVTLTPDDQKNMTEAFCNHILAEGYPTGIYCNRDYLENIFGLGIRYDYDIWYADLEGQTDYPCVYRQYDWHGLPSGCKEEVDLDIYLGDYTAGTAKPKQEVKMIKTSELLKQIHDVIDNIPTVYEQGDQWGAWNGRAFRLDCIIFIKCLVYWGWYYPSKTAAHGGAAYNSATDYTEQGLLNQCRNVASSGFATCKPCSLLYMDGHCGFRIDEFVKDGKTYNAAECTWADAWGTPAKCVYSYVDDSGRRYDYKGGTQNGRWLYHGELSAIDYDSAAPGLLPIEEIAQEVLQGKWGNGEERKNRLRAAGYDPTSVQAEVNRLVAERDSKPAPVTTISMERFISFLPEIKQGDEGEAVKLLQNCLKDLGYYTDKVDGSAGPNTDKAIKAYQTAAGLSPDGVFGPKSWTKLLIG